MLPLDDERWPRLLGGYRLPFDPRPDLIRLRAGQEYGWTGLWENLHHQRDVDLASYAAVPYLLELRRDSTSPDSNAYGLLATIEICRTRGANPPLPDWLASEYHKTWSELPGVACSDLLKTNDDTTVRCIIAALSLAKGLRLFGEIANEFSDGELEEMLSVYWSR